MTNDDMGEVGVKKSQKIGGALPEQPLNDKINKISKVSLTFVYRKKDVFRSTSSANSQRV